MPGVNGIAAAYEIRRVAPATKIVFFTNYGAPRHSAAWRLLGGDAFISKSAGIVELLATLKRLLSPGGVAEVSAEAFGPSNDFPA